MNEIEEMLKMFRKHGVKVADWANGQLYKVEFFPEAANDNIEKRSRADEDADAKVNPSTGLTKAQTRDLLGMDE